MPSRDEAAPQLQQPQPNKVDPKPTIPAPVKKPEEPKPVPAKQPARAAQAQEPAKPAQAQAPSYTLQHDYVSIARNDVNTSGTLALNQAIPDKLVAAANRYNVDPNIICALAHGESTTRHYIPSTAPQIGEKDASGNLVINNVYKKSGKLNKNGSRDIGVMQINSIHTRNGRVTINDLLDVDKNIDYGVRLYRDNLNYFKGDPVLAVMAYGMGPGAVNNWLKGTYSRKVGDNGRTKELPDLVRKRIKDFFGVDLPHDGTQYVRGKGSYAGNAGSSDSSYPASEAEAEIGPVKISKLCIKDGALEFAPPESEQKYKANPEGCIKTLREVSYLAFRKHIYA